MTNPFSSGLGPAGVTDSRNTQFNTKPPQAGGGGWFSGVTDLFSTQKASKGKGKGSEEAYNAQLGPGDHYEGWLKHPWYGDKQCQLLVTRLPVPAGSNEQKIVAWSDGINVENMFGKNGLRELVAQVDQEGYLNGNVQMQNSQGGRSMDGQFQLKKKTSAQTNSPDPLDLATLRYGSEKRSALQQDQSWKTWATKTGVYNDKPQPKRVDGVWREVPSNWYKMRERCHFEKLEIVTAYDGAPKEELRNVGPRFDESVANWMYGVSGGKYGAQWHQAEHMVPIQVVDLFEDKNFGSPDDHNTRSWFMPGDMNQHNGGKDVDVPAKWERLFDTGESSPYQLPVGAVESTPMLGKIYQGAIEDFYFVQACLAISTKCKLVQDLFMNCDFCAPQNGSYILRFYKHGQWQEVSIDGFLPYDKDDNPLCCRHEDFPGVAWPSLAEKAYAKLHGSWMSLGDKGGDVEDVLNDLTGGCAGMFNATDAAADRMWKYFQLTKATTIWACTIDNNECSKRDIPIDKHWASAIFDVALHRDVPVVGVFTSAPFSSVRHFPLVDMGDGVDFRLGYIWLRVDDFAQLFSSIYECRLVNSDLFPYQGNTQQRLREPVPRPFNTSGPASRGPPPPPPGRPNDAVFRGNKTHGVAGGPWYETVWDFDGDVDLSSLPSFLMQVPEDTELVLEVGQEDSRFTAADNAKERRDDLAHGLIGVTFQEFLDEMRIGRQHTRKELEEMWQQLPLALNQTSQAAPEGYITRAPQAPLLLRFFQCGLDMEFHLEGTPPPSRDGARAPMPRATSRKGEMHLVHMSSWAHTRDAMCSVKVTRSGVYMASVSMPPQYSCNKLVFRTYSSKAVSVSYFNWSKNMIETNAGAPLGAIPYSLTGLPRIDSASDRIPRMFDEDEGAGKKQAGPVWLKNLIETYEPETMKEREAGAPQVLGEYGGKDAVATQAATETQAMGIGSLLTGGLNKKGGNLKEVS